MNNKIFNNTFKIIKKENNINRYIKNVECQFYLLWMIKYNIINKQYYNTTYYCIIVLY